jgi:hypothetical protein
LFVPLEARNFGMARQLLCPGEREQGGFGVEHGYIVTSGKLPALPPCRASTKARSTGGGYGGDIPARLLAKGRRLGMR